MADKRPSFDPRGLLKTGILVSIEYGAHLKKELTEIPGVDRLQAVHHRGIEPSETDVISTVHVEH